MPINTYGDITPRTAVFTIKELLKRASPYLVLEQFGQPYVLPTNKSKVAAWRRYEALDATPKPLVEGVTPTGKTLAKTDIQAALVQFGDLITLSDVVLDTHEDPLLQESIDLLAEQAAQMIEKVRFGILRAGTNQFYANGAARSDVNTPITLSLQRLVTRALKRQNGRAVSKRVNAQAEYGVSPIAPSFFAVAHPDLEGDLRNLAGFVPVEHYAQASPYESEVGKVEDVRYLTSTVLEPWPDAGGAKGTMLSTTGTSADVYPVIYFARDAYGIVPLKGRAAITPMVVNPKPSDSDPLGQRGHVSWKSMQTAVILNDFWMAVVNVAVSANP